MHAHERGFIHRDIKPANLILAKDGTVKILDMGLARSLVNPKDELTGKLDDDVITGTADYLSPEQALNVTLDARSDIYSLGATFFTLVTARPPFNGSTAQKLAQHQVAPPNLNKLRDRPTGIERDRNPDDGEETRRPIPPSRTFSSCAAWLPANAGAPGHRLDPESRHKQDDQEGETEKARGKTNAFRSSSALGTEKSRPAPRVLLFVGLLYAIFGGSSKKPIRREGDPLGRKPAGEQQSQCRSNRRPRSPCRRGLLYKVDFANLPWCPRRWTRRASDDVQRNRRGAVTDRHRDQPLGQEDFGSTRWPMWPGRATGLRQTVGNGGVQIHFKCAGRLISLAQGRPPPSGDLRPRRGG